MKVYVTTPIYYVNDQPHVGHAYTTIAADVVARYWRKKLGNDRVFLQVGTDEHGQKIADAAERAGQEPREFVDALAPRFTELWQALNISFDAFLRTTDAKHEAYAQVFFTKLYETGDIYKGTYDGLYCVGCEEYKTVTDLIPSTTLGINDGQCPLHPNLSIQHQKEENYFFRLTKYAERVKAAIETGELQVLPAERRNEMLARLNGEVRDLSISRQSVSWGIPVPWDPSHTFYVWVEALLNYLSVFENPAALARGAVSSSTPRGGDQGSSGAYGIVTVTDSDLAMTGNEILRLPDSSADESRLAQDDTQRHFWPPTYQFMAKDILWFHAAIWPALLLAAGKLLPKTIFAHGFFTTNGQKMSKTLGNVINPLAMIERYGADATRYLLISAVKFGSDGDLQSNRFDAIYTGELSNGLGNLLQRTVTLIKRAELTIEPGAQPSCADVDGAIEDLRLDDGLREAWKIVADANQRLEIAKPWEMLKRVENREESLDLNSQISNLKSVLTTAYRQLETIAAGIAPYMPATSDEILSQLKSLEAKPLFPRLA